MTPPRMLARALAETGGVRHGFFSRRGGVSSGLYAALNCGFGSHDDQDAVVENRARVALALETPADRLLTVFQCHSARCITVEATFTRDQAPMADAMVTAQRGLALGILTADCAPVLLADAEAGVIGAAHAGWRGARDGILEATVAAMERIGAARARVLAAIGPCISQDHYEVGAEFEADFCTRSVASRGYFKPAPRAGHFLFDLARYTADRLRGLGIAEASLIGGCTYGAPDDFFSYRRATHRAEPDYGRNISVIMLP